MSPEEKSPEEMLAEMGQHMYKDFMIQRIDLLNRMKARFGEDVYAVVEEMVATRTTGVWSAIAEREEGKSAADLVRLLWEPLRVKGFEFTVDEREEGIQIQCTKCALYDLAQEIDGTEWMFHLNCGTDPYIVEGFNPEIKFKRTKTLMEGHDCCDHFYGYPD